MKVKFYVEPHCLGGKNCVRNLGSMLNLEKNGGVHEVNTENNW